MELAELRKLVRLMQSAELSELEIDDTKAGLRVHLKRSKEVQGGGGMVPPLVQVMPSGGQPMPVAGPSASAPQAAPAEPGWPAGTEPFPSPMVGTFYRAASPDSDPFVDPGTRVTEESVLCIIEAMKVMNEIKAELRGEVVEVLVENGEPVEFGQPLFLIRKG